MKRHILAASAVLCVLLVADALAQPGGGRGRGSRGGGGLGEAFLLQQASVKQELKLSEEQVGQLTELFEKQRDSLAGFADLGREERRAKFEESQKVQQESLGKILSAEQSQRLQQIGWQQAGPRALANPQIASALSLTDDQKKAIEDAQNETREQMREVFAGGPGGDREAAREKMAELTKQANDKLEKVLTPEQQTKFKELLGAPFTGEIQRPSFRGRGGRREGADDSTQSPRRPFFQRTSFKDNADGKQGERSDAGKDDAKKDGDKNDRAKKAQAEKKKEAHKGRDKKQAKHRHGSDRKKHASSAGHRRGKHHGQRHQASHRQGQPHRRHHVAHHRHHFGRGPSLHASRFAAPRRPAGPNAEAWNRIARLIRERAHHGHRGPAPHWSRAFHSRGAGDRLAFHGFHSQRSHGPGHLGHWHRGYHAAGRGPAPGRGPHYGFGYAHFSRHHGPRGPHHVASWRQHGEHDRRSRDARIQDKDVRPQPPRRPPAPPRSGDSDRSDAGSPPTHRTGDGRPVDRTAQRERLAQLERSLDRLAEQIDQLRKTLQ